MESLTSRIVKDLPASERVVIEHLLGRPLSADQQVFILAVTPATVPDSASRAAARQRLEHTFASQAKRAAEQGTTTEQTDAAVDEAMSQIRQRHT